MICPLLNQACFLFTAYLLSLYPSNVNSGNSTKLLDVFDMTTSLEYLRNIKTKNILQDYQLSILSVKKILKQAKISTQYSTLNLNWFLKQVSSLSCLHVVNNYNNIELASLSYPVIIRRP